MANRKAGYKPSAPFAVAMKLLKPIATSVQGVTRKTFENPDDVTGVFFGSFRTFGGTERESNGVYTLEDTATVDCWFDPRIKANCRIYVCETAATYEIIGTPENIDMRNQYMRLKIRRVGGAA